MDIGDKLGSSKFLLINYDKLCDSPNKGINKIIKFIGLPDDEELISMAGRLVSKPITMQRYKDHDLSQFDCKEMFALERFGFIL
jgi:hypothetical protein